MSKDPESQELLRQSTWESVRHRLDILGLNIHRCEDAATRLAFMRLVEAVQAYEDYNKKT